MTPWFLFAMVAGIPNPCTLLSTRKKMSAQFFVTNNIRLDKEFPEVSRYKMEEKNYRLCFQLTEPLDHPLDLYEERL